MTCSNPDFENKAPDVPELRVVTFGTGYFRGGGAVYSLQRHVIDQLRIGSPVENRGWDDLHNLVVEEAV